MRRLIGIGATCALFALALGANNCGGDDGTSALAPPDSGTSSDAGGAGGGGTSGGNAGSGGEPAGGTGGGGSGAVDAADSPASGGSAGTGEDAGGDGSAPRCNSCWLLLESVSWDPNRLFFADGQRIIWQEGRDTYDPIGTLNVDGSNRQSFTVTGCQRIWSNPTIFGGHVYINNIARVPMGFGPGSSCEAVWTVPTTLNATAYSYFLDTFANVFWVSVYERDVRRLVRIETSRFRATDESNPNALYVRAVDASFLYGTDNPGLGSGSYRLLRYDRTTKLTTVLATRIVGPDMMHVDATSLYFASNGELYKVPKDTTVEVMPTAIPGPMDAWKIAVDGSDVVYFKYNDTQFHRMPLAGGPITSFSTGTVQIRGLTWDQERYFAMLSPPNTTDQYRLVRIPK